MAGCSSPRPDVSAPSVSITPPAGSGSDFRFSAVFRDPRGLEDLNQVGVMVNENFHGSHACYLFYLPPSNSLFLVHDSGSGSDPVLPGSRASVSNGQWARSPEGVTVSREKDSVSIAAKMEFKAESSGEKKVFLLAEDNGGDNNYAKSRSGSWLVR